MAIISETVLESNKKIRVNFDGGNLSSDGGLLLLKEFYHKLGVNSLLRNRFRTTDTASFRIHKDHENLLQMLYQITGAYFQDDHADSLRNDPVLNAVIGKTALASQPTLSRFHNRMDERSLQQLEEISCIYQPVYQPFAQLVLRDSDSNRIIFDHLKPFRVICKR